jgi:hypothetical protein
MLKSLSDLYFEWEFPSLRKSVGGIKYYSPLAIGSSYLTSLGRFPLESVCAGQFVVIGF